MVVEETWHDKRHGMAKAILHFTWHMTKYEKKSNNVRKCPFIWVCASPCYTMPARVIATATHKERQTALLTVLFNVHFTSCNTKLGHIRCQISKNHSNMPEKFHNLRRVSTEKIFKTLSNKQIKIYKKRPMRTENVLQNPLKVNFTENAFFGSKNSRKNSGHFDTTYMHTLKLITYSIW